jgi:hypothetical protein
VSEATLDAAGTVTAAKGCAITNAKADGGTLSFDRLDETLPFPIPDNAPGGSADRPRGPRTEQVHAEGHRFEGGRLHADDQRAACGTLSAKALADGVNLTNLPANPKAKPRTRSPHRGRRCWPRCPRRRAW